MFQTVCYTITTDKIHKPLSMVHLSDLHGACYGTGQEHLIGEIKQKKPDLILMTGDMVDEKSKSFEVFFHLCKELRSIADVYYIPGNHEQALSPSVYEALINKLSALSVTCLINESRLLSIRGDFFRIYGLVTPMKYYRNFYSKKRLGITMTEAYMAELLGSCDSHSFSLLLSHNPLYYPAYESWGADLTLSGHVHGGIIRIPGFRGLLSPEISFFPKYDGGLFQANKKQLIVSRGLGNNFLFRVNNPAELVYIRLLPRT